jgi:hypothetical protein
VAVLHFCCAFTFLHGLLYTYISACYRAALLSGCLLAALSQVVRGLLSATLPNAYCCHYLLHFSPYNMYLLLPILSLYYISPALFWLRKSRQTSAWQRQASNSAFSRYACHAAFSVLSSAIACGDVPLFLYAAGVLPACAAKTLAAVVVTACPTPGVLLPLLLPASLRFAKIYRSSPCLQTV